MYEKLISASESVEAVSFPSTKINSSYMFLLAFPLGNEGGDVKAELTYRPTSTMLCSTLFSTLKSSFCSKLLRLCSLQPQK